MDLKTIVSTAEVLLKLLQKCEQAGQINDAERMVLQQWLADIWQVVNSDVAELKEEVEPSPKEKPVKEQPAPVVEPEPTPEPQPEPVKEDKKEDKEDLEIIENPSKLNHDAVKKLYEDDAEPTESATEEAKAEPASEPQPTEAEPENLPEPEEFIVEKEVMLSPEDEKIINDLEVQRDVNQAAQAGTPLTKLIGINDKFIITRDLFDGDTFAFNRTLATIDNFTNFDEALLYIHNTYPNWDANSDGAQLLIGKLFTKLG